MKDGVPVDEAMGYAPGSDPALQLMRFTNTAAYAAASPFLNGRTNNWHWQAESAATFGATNANCDPWVNGAGLPVVHRDGPMRAIGEIGYVMMPEPGAPWGDVNLVVDPGAALVDVLCAARESEKCRGLFHPGCAPEEVLRALFRTARVGVNGDVDAAGAYLPGTDADMLAGVVRGVVPDRAGDVLAAFGDTPAYLEWLPDGVHTTGNYKEDAVRYIAEAFAFRKNTFIVVYSGQALTPNGRGVRATARGVAYVCRDSYTGRCTVLLRRGLLD